MVLAEFVDGSPSHDFFDDSTDVRQVGFIIKIWRTLRANDAIEFFVSFLADFGVR